jgi:hypothetical protein
MVGQGVLRECLLDSNVEKVVTVVRKSTGRAMFAVARKGYATHVLEMADINRLSTWS